MITIQPLASSFMLKSGCYKDVYQVSGVIQQFMSKCVVGCRVMTNSNKQCHVKKTIADFDACSLYPSAMFYMGEFLKGKPNVLSDKPYEFLTKQDEYFVRVKVIKTNKHLVFPLTSKLDEESGVRNFVNEMGNGIVYIDKVGLEEIFTYHGAEFEIIDGYYYDQGRNITVHQVIEDLYNLKKIKQDKNPAQLGIKLLMNGMYGKTVIKPVETDTAVKDDRNDFGNYIYYNYSYIDSVIEVSGKFYILKRFNQSYLILIMSIVVLKSCPCLNEL